MKRFIDNKKIIYCLGIVLTLMLWQLLSFTIGKKTMIFPGPFSTFREMIVLLGKAYTYKCIFQSLIRMLIGFLIAFILALIIGTIAGEIEIVEDLLKPTLTTLKTIPTASVVFLFIILSGARIAPVYIVILIAFPILYEGVVGGIKNVDKYVIDASKVCGANMWKRIFYISLPLAKPYIVVSILSSLALSFKIEIMSEVITGSTYPGLGSAISTCRKIEPANMVPIFAYSLIAIIISLIIDYFVEKIQA